MLFLTRPNLKKLAGKEGKVILHVSGAVAFEKIARKRIIEVIPKNSHLVPD
jgi:hypothetical protein